MYHMQRHRVDDHEKHWVKGTVLLRQEGESKGNIFKGQIAGKGEKVDRWKGTEGGKKN